LEISDLKFETGGGEIRDAGWKNDSSPRRLQTFRNANVFEFLPDFWLGLSFASRLFKTVSESVLKILRRTPFPLGFFAEKWHKSAFYIPGRNSTLRDP
jgi:hypothetical protein